MILNQISLLDCVVFVVLLVPQLPLQVGISETLHALILVLPFIVFKLPYLLLTEDFLTPPTQRAPFHAASPLFPTLVIRCVRYAFANLPAKIGAVFFSKPVSLPFARWRMLRHGYWPYPPTDPLNPSPYVGLMGLKQTDVFFTERDVTDNKSAVKGRGLKGVWAVKDPRKPPDAVVYYLHGGGFSMGSAWFYLEFLLAWIDLLSSTPSQPPSPKASQIDKQWINPAIFALDYTLVPAAIFPTQVMQVVNGYEFVCSQAGDAPIELAGDSAGASLCLSLLLHLGEQREMKARLPDHTTLISAWTRLISEANKDTTSDYLNADSLHLYARQYLGEDEATRAKEGPDFPCDPTIASPADCKSMRAWEGCMPSKGMHFVYGAEEVLAPEGMELVKRIERVHGDGMVKVTVEEAGIHAWPVVDLFLGTGEARRLKGLRQIVSEMKEKL